MSPEEYNSHLLKIAKEVGTLFSQNEILFRQHLDIFSKKWAEYDRAVTLRLELEKRYRQKSFKDSRLRDQKVGPPNKGHVWYDASPLENRDPKCGFWGPRHKKKLPKSPTVLFVLFGICQTSFLLSF